MKRRRNGAGSLYRRGEIWYTQIKVGGKVLRLSTGETNKRRATARLDVLARGCDLSDEQRLAAVAAALSHGRGAAHVREAWGVYAASPRTQGQPERQRRADFRAWTRFEEWLLGSPPEGGRPGKPGAHPRMEELRDVTPDAAAQFVAEMRGRYSPKTVADTARACRRVWRTLGATPNPWDAVPRIRIEPRLRRAFTDGEVRLIVGRAEGEMRTLLMVGAYTGLRLSDAATLRWECVSGDLSTVTLAPRKTSRSTGAVVSIPVHPALRAELGAHGGSGYVTPGLARLHPACRSMAVQDHLKKCGFETSAKVEGYRNRVAVYGFHSLRSTFITRLADAGMPLAQLGGLVGHVNIEMTQHYYRQDAEAARATLDRLPDFGPPPPQKSAVENQRQKNVKNIENPY